MRARVCRFPPAPRASACSSISRTRVRPALHDGAAPWAGRPGARTLDQRALARDGSVRPHQRRRVHDPGAVRPALRTSGVAVPDGERPRQLGRHAAARASEPAPPTAGGTPLAGRIAVWYLPPAGAQRSYLARAGAILERASLFRPESGRAVAVCADPARRPARARARRGALPRGRGRRGRERRARRTAAWLFAIAALNFACWALITPPFQAPDEVDHFAYTQSLVERGEAPSRSPGLAAAALVRARRRSRWKTRASSPTTRSATRARRGLHAQQRRYREQVAAAHPSSSDGGGNETAATHGAIYYAALAPAYLAAPRTRRSRS